MSDIDNIRKFVKRELQFDPLDQLGAIDECVILLAKVDELEKKLRSANNLINLFKDYKAALNKER